MDGELTQTRCDGKQIVVTSRWALQRDDEGRPVAMLQINRTSPSASVRQMRYGQPRPNWLTWPG